MSQVFRLHTGGDDTITDWGKSVRLGSTAIDSIKDPAGASSKHEITSIPSPFARIELVKTAFSHVADTELDGDTIYHKLVSDALDVGEIFFNIQKYRDVIDIIVWNKNDQINELLNSGIAEHVRLGNTLQTFLDQDGPVYHFDKMNNIYLLNYHSPSAPAPMNIIGATSPATLFFTSANDLAFVGNDVRFGNDKPFDPAYKPLYQRDPEYIKYLWSLSKSIPSFATLFKEFDKYIGNTFAFLPPQLKSELKKIEDSSTYYNDNYDDITVTSTSQNAVEVLGFPLKCRKNVKDVNSDFKMDVSINGSAKIPLALPVETFTKNLMYVTAPWDSKIQVPYFDKNPIQNRFLPADGTQYPYVTIGDFLEDVIIRVPYDINGGYFYDAEISKTKKEGYLLPLKKKFFDYFTVDDLKKRRFGSNQMLTIRSMVSGVEVFLRVPVNGGKDYVQYHKIYYDKGDIDAAANKGVAIDRELSIGVFPPIQYSGNVSPFYRVCVLDRDSVSTGEDNRYSLEFYDESNNKLNNVVKVERNKGGNGKRRDEDTIDSATFCPDTNFNYILVVDNEFRGNEVNAVVIPEFIKPSGSHEFKFAIDFGTTNTHVEYCVDGRPSVALDYSERDRQLQKLFVSDDYYLKKVFDSDFLPDTLGVAGSECHYPMRTVLSECESVNWNTDIKAMAHVNIPFNYEKESQLKYNNFNTDLKWSSSDEGNQRAKKYIECLMVILRNKVLLNGGDLTKTKIVWFYPASMTNSRFNLFKRVWEDSFKKYFNASAQNLIYVSESVAPYYYYRSERGATSDVVSVDIGGGTTDVLFVNNGKPQYLTSFRFAANAVFGDGYAYNAEQNGIVQEYTETIRKKLTDNEMSVLNDVLTELTSQKKSTDITSFFFSLNDSADRKGLIDFNAMLANDSRSKYLFVLFYTAIVYHVAKIMKALSMTPPRHMTFSGNGSRILDILSGDNTVLESYTKLIFERIYGQAYSEDGLTIIRNQSPKETTCKGGIKVDPWSNSREIDKMKKVLIGKDDTSFASRQDSYSNVDDAVKNKVIDSVKNFVNFTFGLERDFSFHENFGTDSNLESGVRKICFRDLRLYLDSGLDTKRKELAKEGADEAIDETLFFYPILGMLNALNREIYKLK